MSDGLSTVEAGENVVYTHTLTNLAAITQTVNLQVTLPPVYPAFTLVPTQTLLLPNAATFVTLTIQVPTTVMSGTEFMATITATGEYGITRTATVVDTTRVVGGESGPSIIYLPLVVRGYFTAP